MSKAKTQKTIIILWGLPACGKSTYAKHSDKIVVDFDKILKEFFGDRDKILYYLASHIKRYCLNKKSNDSSNDIIIDGLVTTNKEALSIIDYLKGFFQEYELIFKIVWWKEDREACLWNDKERREQSSEFSIKNLPFEKPDLSILMDLFEKRIIKMKTQRKSPAVIWAQSLIKDCGLDENPYPQSSCGGIDLDKLELKSSSWSLGGTYSNCWGNKGSISPESPLEFVEFDQLIEKIFPNISFLQYKKITRECCSIREFDDSDYYTRQTKAQHVCDLQKLYNMLIEMKIIEDISP